MATPESPWTHHYTAVYQISEAEGPQKPQKKKPKKQQGKPPKTTRRLRELLVADGTEIGRPGSDLRRVLDTLQDQLLKKPVHPHAVNPTSRLLTFRADADGRPNESRDQLARLLAAEGKDERRGRALALAKQYLTVPNVRAGVLIFLVSEPPGEVGRCAFVFKCDFEAISQIDRRHLFHPIDHAIVETTRKAALYPYYSDGELDPETVRVFDEQGETKYWLNFLELGERTPAGRSHQQATVDRLVERLPEEVVEELEALPPVRPLDARRRSVGEEHQLTPEEAEEVIDEVTRETADAEVTLRLDELRLTAPVAQYHHTWVIAEEGDERYIVLKGDTLEVRSRGVTAIEAVSFESFKEAVRRLGIRCE